MKKLYLRENNILKYVQFSLCRNGKNIKYHYPKRYHHNTEYQNGESILRNGILSIEEKMKRGLIKEDQDLLAKADDTNSHVNGSDGISLSVVGLEDLYPEEEEYDPQSISALDIVVNPKLKTNRQAFHYGNEFIYYKTIKPKDIHSINIRLLEYIEKIYSGDNGHNCNSLRNLIIRYNALIDIARTIRDLNLNIDLIDSSSESNSILLNTNSLANLKKIELLDEGKRLKR